MKINKRHFALLVVVLLLAVFSFPAREQDTKPTIAAVKCAVPGKLTMWVWDENWKKVIGNSIEAWKKDYCPGAEVDLVQQPWDKYWDLLQTSATSCDLPDVFNMTQDRFGFYGTNNALLNQQPYWDKAGVDTTKIWSAGEAGPYRMGDKGELYAAPLNWDTVAILYNKDMFDAAKVPYPTADWTWDDFASAAQKLTDPSKDVYGAAVYAEYQGGYANWIASTGTSPLVNADRTQCTLTDPGSIEALTFLKDLTDKGYMPKPSIMGGSSADDEFKFWASQKVAIIAAGDWKLPNAFSDIKFNWDIAPLPKNPKSGLSRSILHSVGYAVSSKTKNADLAENLVQYLVSDEGQKFMAQGGGVAPANPNPALQQMWIDSFKSDKNVKAYVDATKDSQGVTLFSEIVDKTNTELVVNIFDLGQPVDQVTKDACTFMAPFLNKPSK